ncbi:hypothetical protein K3495_g2721 [Podosphaera aphanis]|nr:hypothetical protein K3495_g2721 [Podosphaera aphanis]
MPDENRQPDGSISNESMPFVGTLGYPDLSEEMAPSYSPSKTPGGKISQNRTKRGLTRSQKQVLVDNLQLEITERARRLRAQYTLQAQGLRTRIEIRVNRIPMALRRVKMQDLAMKYSHAPEQANGSTSTAHLRSPVKKLTYPEPLYPVLPKPPQRGTKRMSNAITVDKENRDIESPRKRSRKLPRPPIHTASHAPPPVLSPHSPNSGTLHHSPLRPASPAKSVLTRSTSPIKSPTKMATRGVSSALKGIVAKVEANRSTAAARKAKAAANTGVGRGKRVPTISEAPKVGRGRASIVSQRSDSSLSTVITRAGPVKKKESVKENSAPAKKGVLGTIKSIGSQTKNSSTTKSVAPAPTASGRVLRKRK